MGSTTANETISMGKWTLIMKVNNVGSRVWPDYITSMFLGHTTLGITEIRDIAEANRLFITDKYWIVDHAVTTQYDTIYDKRIDIIKYPYSASGGLSDRIKEDIRYIKMFCTHNQY